MRRLRLSLFAASFVASATASCSLAYSVDDYTGGTTKDGGHGDVSVPDTHDPDVGPGDLGVDTAPIDTGVDADDVAFDTGIDVVADTLDTGLDSGTDVIDEVGDAGPDAPGDVVDAFVDSGVDAASDVVDATGDTGLDAATDTAPDAATDTIPDAATDTAPDATPETTPDAPPGDLGPCTVTAFTGNLGSFVFGSLSGSAPYPTSVPPSSVASGVTFSDLKRSTSITPTGKSGGFSGSGWSTATTPDVNAYYTFTVTPTTGCALDLSTLSLAVSRSATGPSSVEIATSVDGFKTYGAPQSIGATTATVTLDVPGVSGAPGAVEVRIYGFNASAGPGTFRLEQTGTLAGAIH